MRRYITSEIEKASLNNTKINQSKLQFRCETNEFNVLHMMIKT